ncbi:MAG: hypothetical protein J6J86_05820 [Lachnospiraceae bacterium]|nr:hypothetical protein [Lachnospiraceae bacterium]
MKSEINFLVQVKNGVIVNIGKSSVYHPAIVHKSTGGIKWYDDSKLVKNQR